MGDKKVFAIRLHFKNGSKTRMDLETPVMVSNIDRYRYKIMEEYKAKYAYLEYEEEP